MKTASLVQLACFQWFHRLGIGIVLLLLLCFPFAPGNAVHASTTSSVASQASARYQQMVAGAVHSCGLTQDGNVQCWGSNWGGQLGNGTFYSSGVPVDVSGLSGVTAISAGVNFTCALLDTQQVKCWGDNEFGSLGDGTTQNSNIPVLVSNLSSVKQIGMGGDHACATLENGTIKCWGRNHYGQLGTGDTNNALDPVLVQNLAGTASAVESGMSHTCAILSDETVQCWGSNEFGQLGDGTNDQALLPVSISTLTGVRQLSARRDHTCALRNDGSLQCWGHNWAGQLGNGTTDDANAPVPVVGLATTATKVMTGGGFTCAIETGGLVQCWGANEYGQLGNGSFSDSLVPVNVIGLSSGVVALGSEYSHSCASSPTDTVCWGANWEGELGDGVPMTGSSPREVTKLSNNIVSMVTGNNITCALDDTQSVQCWGSNWAGQLGNGTWDRMSSPTPVSGLDHQVKAISAFDATICALTTGNGVKCWGLNDFGQVGNHSTDSALTPADVVSLQSGVQSITSGRYHNCAILEDKTAKCWGNNQQGQLGNGSTTNSDIPVSVNGLTGVAALTAGSDHTCALLENGTVHCWGGNGDGQLGNGTYTPSLTPVQVSDLSNVKALASSLWNTCALTSTGVVKCWGSGFAGQLGNGQYDPSNVPVDVTGLNNAVTSVAGGFDHFCAIQNGGLFCWGANNHVQLGSGLNDDHLNTPHPVTGMSANITAVSPGSSFTCAVAAGRAKCWGDNSGDQQGLGRTLLFSTPRNVLTAQPKAIKLNYSSGAPGSIFTVHGSGFSAGQSVTVTIATLPAAGSANSTSPLSSLALPQTSLKADALGEFILFVDTKGAPSGNYLVQAADGRPQATSNVSLVSSSTLRSQEGGGTLLPLFHLIYLPSITR